MNKLLITTLLLISVYTSAFGQQKTDDNYFDEVAPGWYRVKIDKSVNATSIIENAPHFFDLSENDKLEISRNAKDALGFTHTRVDQVHGGIKVLGADMVFHEKDGQLISFNGELVKGLELSTEPTISSDQAIQNAITFSGSKKLACENNKHHDFYPKSELTIVQEDFNLIAEDYRLTYKVNVFSIEPFNSKDYFVDAHSGQVLFTIDRLKYTDVPGVAHTKYAGVRNFITDSVSPNHYELRSTTTLNEVITYDMKEGFDFMNASPFMDSNNVWNNVNPQQDEAGPDVHWGNQVTMEFFHERYGVLVNNGRPLTNYVHVGPRLAFAGIEGSYILYGSGDSVSTTSWTSLDVVAHELTHTLLGYTTRLSYRGESGALEESFADIFALAVQFEYDSLNAEYSTGRQFFMNNQIQRSFEDPKVKQHPDTYKGQYWYTGSNSYDWLHSNNGVQNHWFYLLSVGDTGINDNNYSYALPGIGRRKAENIAFRNVVYYLTSNANYQDARLGSIFAAEDLYGICSPEVLETSRAWKAVGVGEDIKNRDLAILDIMNPTTSCALTTNEDFQILLRNFGCGDTLYAGDTVEVFYQFNNAVAVKLSHHLTSNLIPGDSLIVTDPQALNLALDTTYTLAAWINLPSDGNVENDSVYRNVTNHGIYQNSDFEIIRTQPYYIICTDNYAEPISSTIRFWGCDSIPAGDTVYVGVKAYNSSGYLSQAVDTIVLKYTLHRGDELYTHSYPNPQYISASKGEFGEIISWVYHPDDINHSNDSIDPLPYYQPTQINKTNPMVMHNLENATTSQDSMFLRVAGRYSERDNYATVEFEPGSGLNGTQGLQFSGERQWFDPGIVSKYDSVYSLKSGYGSAEVCFCLETFQWPGDSLFLEFDLRQTASKIWENSYNKDFKNSSKLWISANQNRITDIFYPTTFTQDQFVHYKIDLTDRIAHDFELCLRAENFISASLDTIAGSLGDNVYIDNIYIHDENHHVTIAESELTEVPIEIYPNPSSGIISIQLSVNKSVGINTTVYNSAGVAVKDLWIHSVKGANIYKLDLTKFPPGVYFVKVTGDEFQAIEKLIIQ